MHLKPRTILGQFITGSVIVQILVFATFLVVTVRGDYAAAHRASQDNLKRQAKLLAGVLGEPLATGNQSLLGAIARAVPLTSTIKGARVTDARGNPLRTSSTAIPTALSADEQTLLADLLNEPRYYTLTLPDGVTEGVQPVMLDGAVRGVVWVVQNPEVTARNLRNNLGNVLIYAVFALIGNVLLLWALSATLARPLRRLRQAALQVQHDPNDLSAFPLHASSQNEAGMLTASVNAMVAEIARQRRGTQETLNLVDSLLGSAPFGFAFYDRQFRYLRLNDYLAQMHGVPVERHIGRTYRELLPRGASQDIADQMEASLSKVFESGETLADIEISGLMPGEQHVRTYRTTYFPVVLQEGGVRWAGVITSEITERKRNEEVLRRSEKLAAAGRLAASIAHEINNPLESITNVLYLLQHHTQLPEDGRQYVEIAQAELQRVSQVAQQTLRFYRPSATPTDVRLSEMLRSVLVLHHARLQSPRIEVEYRLSDKAIFFGYAGELRQMFANIIGNAIDAMPQGGRLVVSARPGRRLGKRGVRVTVADTGTGISKAVLKRIFEPYFTTKEPHGTGLGLWASEDILAKHRASRSVRSCVARFQGDRSGTVFSIFFPLDGVPRGPVMVTSSAQVLADHVV